MKSRFFIRRRLTGDDLLMVAVLSIGIIALGTVALYASSASLSIKSPTVTLAKSVVSSKAQTEGKGVYALGKIEMTVGSSDGFLDAEVILEYDRALLREQRGTFSQQEKDEKSYLNSISGKIRDAIVMNLSDIAKIDADVRLIKQGMADVINDRVMQGEEVVTTIYFTRYMMVPPERRAP
jgi:hypothetical protein